MSPMQIIVAQWLYSLKHYLLMCLLLSSPDRLPYNPYPIALTGFVYFLLGLLLVDAQHSYPQICMQILLEMGMLGMISWFILQRKNLLQRFRQTFSALLGINVIITSVAIPTGRLIEANSTAEDSLLLYSTLMFLIWNLAVLSLIFKRSFDVSTHLSSVMSFCYFVVYQITVYWLSP